VEDNIVLSTKEVTKKFGEFVAVDRVSVDVPRTLITLIIGPNGSGKTTLVNAITGVYKPDGGRVFYFNRGGERIDITGWPPHKIFELGIVRSFQVPQLFSKLTVMENVMVASRGQIGERLLPSVLRRWVKQERELAERAFKILELVGLYDAWNLPVYKLSAGQMKLLEVARALMAGAELVILDEPIAGVPPTQAHDVFKTIRSIKESQGITFLVIEHRIDIAFKYVDLVYAMASGRVIAKGSPDEVANNPLVIESYIGG